MRKFDDSAFLWLVAIYVVIVISAWYFGECPYVQSLCE